MTDLLTAAPVFARVERGALRRLVHAQELRNDLADYMRWAWPLSHKEPLQWNWHLGAITEHLEACKLGQIKRLLVNEPPRHLKSWTASVAFPSWWWADDPTVQFLAATSDKDVVFRDADAQRDLCKSPEYQAMFRPTWDFKSAGDGSKQEAKGYYRNTAGGHRISKVMGQKGQGVDADVILIDDPLDSTDAYNDKAALVEHVVTYRQKIISRLNNPATGIVVLFMQRVHQIDLAGVMIEEGGWEQLILPAEWDGKKRFTILGSYDPRTEEGELLFPARFPQDVLDQKKIDLTARGYAGQYQQLPAPATGAMVLKKWVHYWTNPGAPLLCLTCGKVHELPEMDYQLGSWDCSFGSKTADADYVVGQVWGAAGSNAYLQDQCRRKMSVPEMIEAMRTMNQDWENLRENVVEKKAAGKHVMETLATEIYGLHGFDPQGQSKEERLGSTLPRWEQGQIFLPHPQLASFQGKDYSWVQDVYVPELLMFNNGRYDDQVDTTSQALIRMREIGPTEGAYIKVLG